jgi:predicted amidohydrolase YtcJ
MFEPAHVDRAKRQGVVVVQNPSHFMVAPTMRARLGERVRRTTLVKTIVRAGIPFALGSDGPMNPFLNIMFAGINEVNPAEALTIEEALTAYTAGAAYAEMMERHKGTLAPDMLADLAILSQDIFNVPPPELPKTVSVLTIVGGRVVHDRIASQSVKR